MAKLEKTLVFDIPTRVFHWTFAISFILAFAIGKFSDDEAALYPLHMLLGVIMALAVVLRLIWGIIGTKYARFASFKLNPIELVNYFKSVFSGTKTPNIERNPASSFAAIIMMLIALIIPITGWFMLNATNRGQMHDIKEIHEALATIFAIIAALHILGIIIHTISQKDPIGLAMINGHKNSVKDQVGIKGAHPLTAMVFLAIIGGSGFALASQYDAKNQSINIAGKNLVLGENEGADEGKEEAEEESEESEESGENKNIKNAINSKNEVEKYERENLENEAHEKSEKENDKD